MQVTAVLQKRVKIVLKTGVTFNKTLIQILIAIQFYVHQLHFNKVSLVYTVIQIHVII